ncbi:MAG: hypothetical protein KC583_13425 [Myxococcales bacterium]|nr:hypothetical protein [Myxococcales bacterium]
MSDETNRGTRPGGFGQLLGGLGGLADGPAGTVYEQWQTWAGQQFERMAQNPAFAKQLGRAFEVGGPLRGLLEGAVKTALAGLPYAKTSTVEELQQRVERLERTVGRLQAAVDRATAQQKAGGGDAAT